MKYYTHLAFSMLFFSLVSTLASVTPVFTLLLVSAFGALLPDIDHPGSILGKYFPYSKYISKKYGHRTLTHSFLFLGIIAIIALPLIILSKYYYLALISGVLSHLVSDGFNVSGVPLLYPSPKIFYFLPNHFLIKTGSKEELLYLLIMSVFAITTIGVSYIGIRSAAYSLAPGFNSLLFTYKTECDGLGKKNICSFEGEVCGEYCGPLSGTVLGIDSNKFTIYNKSYYVIDRNDFISGTITKVREADISIISDSFTNQPLALRKPPGLVTVSGELKGKLYCPNPVNKMDFHHALVGDLPQCAGFVESGHLNYKIRQ